VSLSHATTCLHMWVHPTCASRSFSPCLLTGIVKMTIPTAFTTTMLAWSMLSFPKAYTAAGTVDRTMSQVGWGADYLTKTFTTSVAATNTTNGTTGSIVYQVCICLLMNFQEDAILMRQAVPPSPCAVNFECS
jgi:Glycosyl hydrolase family 9